jgi:hypothetical protein
MKRLILAAAMACTVVAPAFAAPKPDFRERLAEATALGETNKAVTVEVESAFRNGDTMTGCAKLKESVAQRVKIAAVFVDIAGYVRWATDRKKITKEEVVAYGNAQARFDETSAAWTEAKERYEAQCPQS